MRCQLCEQDRELRDSHVIPKFAATWLKATSATGYLRGAASPNLRRQGFPTRRLLCSECEGLFSRWETQFAERIFLPYHESGQGEFHYKEWLMHFAISLVWRTGIAELESFVNYRPHLVPYLEQALSSWRNQLLGESVRFQAYAHHLLFLDFVVEAEGLELPEGFHWYALRGIDAAIPASNAEVFVYAKLPGMVFFSGVRPAQPAGWENTQICLEGTISASDQHVTQGTFGEFLLERVRQAWPCLDALSTRQEQKIIEAMTKDRARTRRSQSLQVHLAEWLWKRKRGAG